MSEVDAFPGAQESSHGGLAHTHIQRELLLGAGEGGCWQGGGWSWLTGLAVGALFAPLSLTLSSSLCV